HTKLEGVSEHQPGKEQPPIKCIKSEVMPNINSKAQPTTELTQTTQSQSNTQTP
ncbi:15737_t:CDS:1, partial [Dentiscutata erythropus]